MFFITGAERARDVQLISSPVIRPVRCYVSAPTRWAISERQGGALEDIALLKGRPRFSDEQDDARSCVQFCVQAQTTATDHP